MGQRTRLYAHCAKSAVSGAVVVFGFNMGRDNSTLSVGQLQQIEEYVLTPANSNLQSQTVFLNGERMSLVDGTKMPNFKPRVVIGDEILVKGGTIGFWVFPQAGNRYCL